MYVYVYVCVYILYNNHDYYIIRIKVVYNYRAAPTILPWYYLPPTTRLMPEFSIIYLTITKERRAITI